jgi:hypothetical protein
MKSPVYGYAFWVVLLTYIFFLEFYFRLSPAGQGSVAVLWAWLEHGNARVLLSVIWSITTLAFIMLAADHLRNIYVSLTGTSDAYIFLGDKLREGMYVAGEKDPGREPVYVEYFVNKNQYPAASFNTIYNRILLLRDGEGNLTPAMTLAPGRLILFAFLQLVLLLFSVMCLVSVVDQFIAGFPGANSIQDISRATNLPGAYKNALFSLLALIYVGGIALVSSSLRSASRAQGKVLPLPAHITEGAVLSGRIVAMEDYTIDNSQRSLQHSRFYRRYTVCFDGTGFPLPVYINWTKQRLHEGNISSAAGRLKKERAARKKYYDSVFEYLDEALKSGTALSFCVGEEYDIIPQIDVLGAPPGED